MTYDIRNGIKAKQVYISFTDAVRNSVGSISLDNSDFQNNKMELFWGAYYGDLVADSVSYSISDLGFDSTGATGNFKTTGYDTIADITEKVISLTSNSTMVVDAHANKYVIVRKANGKKVLARIVSNTATTITTDEDLTKYGVANGDTIILLVVPFGLNMKAYQRLDHIATNFELTEPTIETNDTYFLGTSDAQGSQNMAIDKNPPSKLTGSVTIRGAVAHLEKLKYAVDSAAPTGRTRYNLGTDAELDLGLTVIYTTNESDIDNSNAVTKMVFCNNIIVKSVGALGSVSSEGKAEATVEFEVRGSDVRVEKVTAQDDDVDTNI
jgi:hypothetical protein